MKCPKCGKKVGEHDAVCSNCGIALQDTPDDTALIKSVFGKKKKSLGTTKPDGVQQVKNKVGEKRLKLILFSIALVLLITLIIIIVVSITGTKGEKIAENVSEFIGSELADAEKKCEVHFKDESAYAGVNNAIKYDYAVEADDTVTVDGITYPEWGVFITLDDSDCIETVKYSNFKLLEDNVKGEERDRVVNLDKFEKGVTFGTVSDEIDLDYYSVVYALDADTYNYRYWYKTESGDVQPVVLSVTFDKNHKYLYYSSTLLYPQNM